MYTGNVRNHYLRTACWRHRLAYVNLAVFSYQHQQKSDLTTFLLHCGRRYNNARYRRQRLEVCRDLRTSLLVAMRDLQLPQSVPKCATNGTEGVTLIAVSNTLYDSRACTRRGDNLRHWWTLIWLLPFISHSEELRIVYRLTKAMFRFLQGHPFLKRLPAGVCGQDNGQ